MDNKFVLESSNILKAGISQSNFDISPDLLFEEKVSLKPNELVDFCFL